MSGLPTELALPDGRGDLAEWCITDRILGHGGFAHVYEAVGPGGTIAAAKAVDKQGLSPGGLEQLESEVACLQAAQSHPHVIGFIGAAHAGRWLIVLSEAASGDILHDVLSQQGLDEDHAKRVVRQILRALAHCHRRGIFHGDVKPENILIGETPDADVRLADFGSALVLDGDGSGGCPLPSGPGVSTGTALYSAPEVLRNDHIGLASDMWSLGVTTYVLLSGCFPFSSVSDSLYRRASFSGAPWHGRVSASGRAFIQALLRQDPAQRLTAQQALKHPWLLPELRCGTPLLQDPLCTTPPLVPTDAEPPEAVTPTKRRWGDERSDDLAGFSLDVQPPPQKQAKSGSVQRAAGVG